MSSAFSWFVILGTLVSLLAFFLLLHFNRHGNAPGETTGHNYDGIEEYDNPLPGWWYWGFILSILFALGYLVYYPGLGNFPGVSGWTKVSQLEQEQQLADARYGPIFAQYRDIPVEELASNTAANKIGHRLFINNCAVCHGSAGKGGFGFPNLTDSEWQWGGSGDAITTTLLQGRQAAMPGWQAVLGPDEINDTAEYVLTLAGRDTDADASARGQSHYTMYCVACHGNDGGGNPMLGSPALNDEVWLYGNSKLRIVHTLQHGRNGVMPAFRNKLGEDKVHILAAYVKSLSSP